MTKVTTNAACVHCLKKPLVVIIPQDIERDDDLWHIELFIKHPFLQGLSKLIEAGSGFINITVDIST